MQKDKINDMSLEELEHLKRTKYAKYLMNEMQLKVKETADNIKDLIDDAEKNNMNLRDEVHDTQKALDQYEEEKSNIAKGQPFIPGRKIAQLL